MKVEKHSERIMLVKVNTEPVNLVTIQVHTPSIANSNIEVKSVYEKLNDLIAIKNGKG